MARPLSQIEKEVRSLSTAEKEALLRVLWEELDGPADPEVEAAWLREVSRRSASGSVVTWKLISAQNGNRIQVMLVDSHDTPWIGTRRGLFRIDHEKITPVEELAGVDRQTLAVLPLPFG